MTDLLWAVLGLCLVAVIVLAIDRVRLGRVLSGLRTRNEIQGHKIRQFEAATEAQRRAEAASQAKSRFLATVSHEIRTPLNGILGIADLLQGTPLDREQFAYVEAVKTSGQALATLIDEILDFSRIEAGKLELGSEPFELAPLVEGVLELLAPRAQDKGLEIAAFVDPALPRRLVGDAVRLRQVLTNLAGNAVKFTTSGGVGLRVERIDGGAVRFSVADTGPGVPAENRQAIFQEFEQGDGSTTRRHGGTGLGLAISSRIVGRMGSAIVLDDRPGGGSIFAFEVAMATAETGPDAATFPAPALRGQRALIAARSLFQAPFLAAQLETSGAEVTQLSDETAVRQHLEDQPRPDWVFIDCALGQALTERLCDSARTAGAGRIFLLFSPFERRAFGQKLVEGFDGWLVKPVRAASLAARLAGDLRSARARPAGPSMPALAPRRCLRVLLAEDNDINALVAMNYLGKLGAQAVHASDGRSALALALAAMRGETPSFDVIVMDVSMPELDGLDVARRIRAAEAEGGFPATSIVALTAHAFAEDRATFLQAGMDDVLTKPIDFNRFCAALARRKEMARAV